LERKKGFLINAYFSLTNKSNLFVKGNETNGPLLSCLHTSCIVNIQGVSALFTIVGNSVIWVPILFYRSQCVFLLETARQYRRRRADCENQYHI